LERTKDRNADRRDASKRRRLGNHEGFAVTDSTKQPVSSPAELLASGAAVGTWRLDAEQSRISFAVKHFWGAITVRGSFGVVRGEATVGADGTVTGQVTLDAASLNTKNKKRDEHLRSNDFFNADTHPEVTLTLTSVQPVEPDNLSVKASMAAAGHARPIEFTAHVDDASAQAITLHADVAIDRTDFAMTWSPLGIASKTATTTAVTRWVRA
jgi:polyisoprenoid-binding protein YceI